MVDWCYAKIAGTYSRLSKVRLTHTPQRRLIQGRITLNHNMEGMPGLSKDFTVYL